MKIFRKLTYALGLIALFTPILLTSGCTYLNKVIAKDALNQGVIYYNQGKFKTAQDMFIRASNRDPESATAWLYYGATLYKDYQALSGPERTTVANQALDVYKKALDLSSGNCKNQDSAITYIALIYEDLENMDEWRNWLLKRADGSCPDNDTKAATYYSVGVKYWKCSYDQTTRYKDKTNQDPWAYRNMDYDAAKADKQKAEECAAKGLEYIEKAIQVDPEDEDAYFYKGLLIRERLMMTKEAAKRKELDQLAQKLTDQGSALKSKKEQLLQQKQQAAQAAPQG